MFSIKVRWQFFPISHAARFFFPRSSFLLRYVLWRVCFSAVTSRNGKSSGKNRERDSNAVGRPLVLFVFKVKTMKDSCGGFSAPTFYLINIAANDNCWNTCSLIYLCVGNYFTVKSESRFFIISRYNIVQSKGCFVKELKSTGSSSNYNRVWWKSWNKLFLEISVQTCFSILA